MNYARINISFKSNSDGGECTEEWRHGCTAARCASCPGRAPLRHTPHPHTHTHTSHIPISQNTLLY